MENSVPNTSFETQCADSRQSGVKPAALLSVLLVIMAPQHALALDAMDFFRGLQVEAEKDGNTLTYGKLESLGDEGARASEIKVVDGESGDIFTIGQMELTGTGLVGNDGFSFADMTARDLRLISERKEGSTSSISIGTITASEFRLPPAEMRIREFWPLDIGEGRMDMIRIVSSGAENISLNIPSIEISDLNGSDNFRFDLGSFVSAPATGSFAAENGANGAFLIGAISMTDLKQFGTAGLTIGSFEVGAIGLTGSDEKDQAISFAFDGASGTNVFNPEFDETGAIFPEGEMAIEFKGASFRMNGTEILRLGRAETKAEYDKESSDYAATARVNDIFINIEEIPAEPGNETGRKQFAEMGYDSLTMDIDMAVNWNLASGLLDISKYRIAARDMAVIDFGLKIGGYDERFAQEMQSISNRMRQSKDPEMQQALGFQLMGMMSGLEVVEIDLSFDDQSLTNRVLEVQARQSGQSAEDMAAALPFMAGAMLAEFEVPEFAASVAAALSTFLGTSGTLTLSAKPENPVSLAELMGIMGGFNAGNVKPAELIERFNVTVRGK